jgi:hypothetical protein
LPGERDISRPQVVVPEEVRDLLDRLREPLPDTGALPRVGPEAPEAIPEELLDYLLAP